MDVYILQHYHTPSKKELEGSIYITWVGHRKCSPQHVIGPRMLENYKIIFVLSGKGYLEQGNDKRITLNAGDMFVLFPRKRHYYFADPDDPWEIMWISFNGSSVSTMLSFIGISKSNYTVTNALSNPVQIKMQQIITAIGENDASSNLLAIGYLYLVFAEIGETIKNNMVLVKGFQKEDIISEAVTFIEQNYYMHIDVDILCRHVSYSRSYLSRLFKNNIGMTIPEYVNKIRMQKAMLLLRETDLCVQEVASSVGMSDPFYFSKTFKKFTGRSPTSYKKEETHHKPEHLCPF